MAWYIMRTAASMPPRSRDKSSRHWLGPFATEEASRRECEAIRSDGVGMTDLCVEEDSAVTEKEERGS